MRHYGKEIQRIWLDPKSHIVHTMDAITPFTFTGCGVGMSTGLRLVYADEPPKAVTCLECIASS